MSRAEYERFYNWQESDSVTREPMRIYKSKGVANMFYNPTRLLNNVITYKQRNSLAMRMKAKHVDQEPTYRRLTNEPKIFLSSR